MGIEISQEEYNQQLIIEQQKELLDKLDKLIVAVSKQKPIDIATPFASYANEVKNALQQVKPTVVKTEAIDVSSFTQAVVVLKSIYEKMCEEKQQRNYEFDVQYTNTGKINKVTAKQI
jgi:hypothetical protein